MPEPHFILFKQLLQIVPRDQRLVVIYNGEAVLPEDTFDYGDKYVIDVRALQYPQGDVGLGITLTDTIVYMPDLRGLFGTRD